MIVSTHDNTWVLAACQCLFTAGIAIDLTLTGLAGQSLVMHAALATLPFALITVGGAITAPLAGRAMQRLGRRIVFLLGALLGMTGGLISAGAVARHSFAGLCAGATLVGMFQTIAQYYRLAAADGVPAHAKGRAISLVLAGGVLAALFGPPLATWSNRLLPDLLFAGAYLVVAILAALSLLLLLIFYQESSYSDGEFSSTVPAVSVHDAGFTTLLKRPIYLTATVNGVIGNATMMFIMTAAPIASVAFGHRINDSAGIMQWHLVGMYAPALVSAWMLARLGISRVILIGVLLSALCPVLALSGTGLVHFYAALLCLGVGWNFMFVASSTLLVQADDSSQRFRIQGWSETLRYIVTAVAGLSSGLVLQHWGWKIVNVLILPPLIVAASTTLWWVRKRANN